MLVLTRRAGEAIVIDGDIRVRVLKASGSRVRIGIEAPDDVRIVREKADQSPPIVPREEKAEEAAPVRRSRSDREAVTRNVAASRAGAPAPRQGVGADRHTVME